MTIFDEIAEKTGDDQWEEWKNQVLGARDEIAAFVASRRQGDEAREFINWFEGSFNFCLQVTFDDGGPDAIIRFPGLGHTTFREEKIVTDPQIPSRADYDSCPTTNKLGVNREQSAEVWTVHYLGFC